MSKRTAVLEAKWKVKGKGDSKAFLAMLPDKAGMPGATVKLINAKGVETFGTLVEIVERDTDNQVELWSFAKQAKTTEQWAADQVKVGQWWASPAGQEAARKRDERTAKKQQAQTTTPATTSAPTTTTVYTVDVDAFAAQVAAFIKAGLDPAAATIAAQTMGLSPAPIPATQQVSAPSTPNVTTTTTTTPPAPDTTPAVNPNSRDRCRSCGMQKAVKNLGRHEGAQADKVCTTCQMLDADTVRARIIRREVKGSK
jgi:hypothetical protein